MKTINIYNSNDDLEKNFLEDKFKNIKRSNDNSISITLNSFNDLSELALRLSMYSVHYIESNTLTKLKKHLSKGYFDEEIFNQIQNQDFKYIYVDPLTIIYTEYLKDNTILDLESFLVFNCRGLEKDFFKLTEEYLQIYKYELSSNSIAIKGVSKNNDEEISTQKYYSYIKELHDIICRLKDESTMKEIDYKRFDTIHITNHNEKIILTDSNNNPIENYIETILDLNMSDKFKNNDTALKKTMFILACISILNTSTIIFHQSIPKKTLSRILLFLYDSKEINPDLQKINLIKCNGCNLCHLK